MKYLFFMLTVMLGITNSTCAQSLSWMEGSWTGKGYQPNLGKYPYWQMEMKISFESGEGTLKIEYPSIPCSANWELISSEPKSAVFIEKLVSGKDLCIDGSRITVSYVDDNQIMIVFYEPENMDVEYASAKLKRK